MARNTIGEKRVLDALSRGKLVYKRALLKQSEISNLTRERKKRAMSISSVNHAIGYLIEKGHVIEGTSYELGGTINGKKYKGRGYRIK